MPFWHWVAGHVSPYITPALEARMSKTDEALADLDRATTEIADELDELHAAAAAVDADLAAKIHAKADHLRALAADPADPIPDMIPETPAPEVDEVPGTQDGMDEGNQSGTEGIAGIGRTS